MNGDIGAISGLIMNMSVCVSVSVSAFVFCVYTCHMFELSASADMCMCHTHQLLLLHALHEDDEQMLGLRAAVGESLLDGHQQLVS